MARSGRKAPFPTRDELLRYIQDNPDRASKREIARAFGIKGDARKDLKTAIRSLIDEGALERRRGRRIGDPNKLPNVTPLEVSDIDVDGELWCRPVQWDVEKEAPRVLLMPDRKRANAPALGVGDRVLARVNEKEDGTYEARVMRVIGRGPDQVVGVFDLVGGHGRIHPADRTGRDLWVAGPDSAGAQPGDLVHAEVLPARRLGLQQGRVIERIGHKNDPRALSLISIHTHDLPTRFKPEAIEAAERATVPALGSRTDLCDVPLVTIDPEDARDFDDAIWAEPDPDTNNPGGWHLLIAIADVAHYVRSGTALDADAAKRGNSAYFPDRVVPMLPDALSSGVCSLRPNEVRACMAVEVWVDRDGKKRRHRFVRGLMRSAHRFTYARAQELHDSDANDPVTTKLIVPLYAAHEALKKARSARSPLALNLPERVVKLAPQGDIVSVEPRTPLPSHQLVEDFMILANVCAAETLEEKHLPCMYRVHDEPDREKLAALRDFLKTMDLSIAPGQVLKPKTFNAILAKAAGSPVEHLINQVVLRAQAQAVYSPDNLGHFGLALARYAHFTSPIRRYADLLVHRSLIAACNLGNDGLAKNDNTDWRQVGEKISHAERRAMVAERDAVDRFTALYLSKKVGALFHGRVSGVSRFGLFVTLEESGADGLVPIRSLGAEFFQHDEAKHALVGEKSGETWRLGDAVRVKLLEADPVGGRLRLEVVSDAPTHSAVPRRRGKRPSPARRGGPRRR